MIIKVIEIYFALYGAPVSASFVPKLLASNLGDHPEQMHKTEVPSLDHEHFTSNLQYLPNSARSDVSLCHSPVRSCIGTKISDLKAP